jgi:hypothetical protein
MTVAGDNFVLLLVDESSAMSTIMRDKTADGTESVQSNAQRIATAVNSLLRQLSEGPGCDVAVVGYRSDAEGKADVGVRWPATLKESEFVASDSLPAAARVENRTRKVPLADGSVRSESVAFPVWYESTLGSKAPQIAAFTFCRDLIQRRSGKRGGAAIIIHVFSGASSDGNPQRVIDELTKAPDATFVVQCHVAASSTLVTTAFPSKQAFVASGMARDLFARGSELTEAMRDLVESFKVPVQSGARAVVHNAKMSDVFRCLQLAKQYVAGNTAATPSPLPSSGPVALASLPPSPSAAESPAALAGPIGGSVVLVVLVLDRSVEDPFSGKLPNACSRLSEAGNEFLKLLTAKDFRDLPIHAAIVSYGVGGDGAPEVRATFDGPLAGRAVVPNSELLQGAIRVEECETQVSNGAGGLITMTKKTPIFFDVEPTACASPQAALAAASTIVADWLGINAGGRAIVLHLTRGGHVVSDIAAAASEFGAAIPESRRPALQNLVLTEVPHMSLAYPDTEDEISIDSLMAWWRASGALPHWQALQAAKRPYITAGSKAFVINGKYDVLADELANALGKVPAAG